MSTGEIIAAPTGRRWVEFSQDNGIVMYGIVIGAVSWDSETPCAVVRYCWNPDGDPPRRSYRIVPSADLYDAAPREGWLTAAFPW